MKQRYGEDACNLDNLSDNSSSDSSDDDDEVVSYIKFKGQSILFQSGFKKIFKIGVTINNSTGFHSAKLNILLKYFSVLQKLNFRVNKIYSNT